MVNQHSILKLPKFGCGQNVRTNLTSLPYKNCVKFTSNNLSAFGIKVYFTYFSIQCPDVKLFIQYKSFNMSSTLKPPAIIILLGFYITKLSFIYYLLIFIEITILGLLLFLLF